MAITISGDTPNFSAATITTGTVTTLTSTTGTVTTLTAPTSTITTLNAPSGVLATQNGMTGIAKAWVNFDGTTATPSTINNSFNVASITKTGTGAYTINFTTSMPNANYSLAGMCNADSRTVSIGSLATSSASIRVSNTAATLVDLSIVCVSIFSS